MICGNVATFIGCYFFSSWLSAHTLWLAKSFHLKNEASLQNRLKTLLGSPAMNLCECTQVHRAFLGVKPIILDGLVNNHMREVDVYDPCVQTPVLECPRLNQPAKGMQCNLLLKRCVSIF